MKDLVYILFIFNPFSVQIFYSSSFFSYFEHCSGRLWFPVIIYGQWLVESFSTDKIKNCSHAQLSSGLRLSISHELRKLDTRIFISLHSLVDVALVRHERSLEACTRCRGPCARAPNESLMNHHCFSRHEYHGFYEMWRKRILNENPSQGTILTTIIQTMHTAYTGNRCIMIRLYDPIFDSLHTLLRFLDQTTTYTKIMPWGFPY